jgi:alkyldihydroxyacetonephosphate synthase
MDPKTLRRINTTCSHINPDTEVEQLSSIFQEACAAKKYDPRTGLRWNGYGYADTAFFINQKGLVEFRGPKYDLHGKILPEFKKYVETECGFNEKFFTPSQNFVRDVPAPISNAAFEAEIKGQYVRVATDDQERVFHSHGHTLEEIFRLRHGACERIPDLVVYPGTHAHVVAIVAAANQHNVVIIPFGGGTSVTNAVMCPNDERRTIVSLDMREMNKVKWVDTENMLACIEAGASGEVIEEQLRPKGLCFGHEPDSYEFSTMGGWIATRASGMKKNVYGNIEDLLISCKLVTSVGVVENKYSVPRLSCGPDINEMTIGSEGNFGVITEAIVKIKKIPECKTFGAVAFPSFQAGFNTLKELAMNGCYPASIRLMDNEQFRLANALKPAEGPWTTFMGKVKKFYIANIKGFNLNQLCAATLAFEGSKEQVAAQEKMVYETAKKYGGLKADEESGRRGYTLTFMIAYIRDIVMDYSFIAESFETSVSYKDALKMCDSVKKKIKDSCLALGVTAPPFVCCRITQLYDTGCAVYFYFAMSYKGLKDPVKAYLEIEQEAREEILRLGGSISHHHGVGKLRAQFLPQVLTPSAMGMLRAIKGELDPNNVFAARNMNLGK